MTVTEKSINYDQYEKVPVEENGKQNEKEIPAYGFGVRHVQAFLAFLCLTINFIVRAHLGVTIVAMVDNSTPDIGINGTNTTEVLFNNETEINTVVDAVNEIARNNSELLISNETMEIVNHTQSMWNVYRTYSTWDKPIQEMILGSFFLGYLLLPFPFGIICQRYGGKLPLQIALVINGILSILTPWCALWGGYWAVCACRVMQGLCQCGVYPGVITLLAKWVPISERGRMSTYVFSGTAIGTILAFQVGGFLAASTWGWPSTFWLVGILCLLTFVLMTIFGTATPQENKFITDAEKRFILGKMDDGVVKRRGTPWKQIFMSKHMWATLTAHVGCGSTFVFFLNQVPSYLHNILGVDVQNSGLFSSLPYIFSFIVSTAVAILSEYCTNKKIISVKASRIICNSIASIGMALSMAAVSFTRSTFLAVMCLIAGLGAQGTMTTGWMVNYIDLAPNYSGVLMATGNTFMNIFTLSTPWLVVRIVRDMTNVVQWRIMMFLVAGLSVITNAIFVTFISVEVQPWNDEQPPRTGPGEKEMEAMKKLKD